MALEFRVFLSAVTSEFGTARDALAKGQRAVQVSLLSLLAPSARVFLPQSFP